MGSPAVHIYKVPFLESNIDETERILENLSHFTKMFYFYG